MSRETTFSRAVSGEKMKLKILFVCATNSVQSPMAEALLNRMDSEHFEATSAGIRCGEMHPLTVDAMREIGIDLEGRDTRSTRDVLHRDFDFVITLSESARFGCPSFDGAELVHWRFDDPLAEPDSTKQKHMFQSLREQIAQRVRLFALVQTRSATVNTYGHQEQRLSA
jgi:ArsR family transcriptional regulator, arsenate/arsenite/antimonite-responsive transcriptional repressor / arsenate reductase (thioredoxin)